MKYLKVLWPLFLVQFFTWLGLFSLWIYSTPVITQYVFHAGKGNSINYQQGIRWVGFCFAFYSLLAGFLGFLIPKWSKKLGLYNFHALCLALGSLGLMGMAFISQPVPYLLSFSFIGIAWASIGNVPYTLVGDLNPEGDSQKIYLFFNFSIIIPQVFAAFLLGSLTENNFHGDSRLTLLFGGISMFLGALLMTSLYQLKIKKPHSIKNEAPQP